MGGFQYCCFEQKKFRDKNNIIRLTNNKIVGNTPLNLKNHQKLKRGSSEKYDNSKNNSDIELNKVTTENNFFTNKENKKKKFKNLKNIKNNEDSFNKFKKKKKNKSTSVDCPNSRKNALVETRENTKYNDALGNNYFRKGTLIGEGRFGKVYSGLSNSGNIITIKTYNKISDFKKKEIIKNLSNLYKLNHNNIIKALPLSDKNIYDEHGDLCIAYESINSKNVDEIIQNFGNLDEKIIQIYIKQLLEGLKYLHENKVYHKNLKPSNIFADSDGTIKISDCLVDSLILGSGIDIYNSLLESDKIEYYIPPFFIQAIYKYNEQNNETNEEINNMNNSSENIFDDWKSYDLWFLGCLIIEVSSRKNPWYHYNFKNNSAFFDFLANTNLSPILPKKLSSQCKELIKILLNYSLTKREDIYDIIFDLDFFKMDSNNFTYNNTNIVDPKASLNDSQKIFFQNDGSNFSVTDNLRSESASQLGQILANNKVVNILNSNNNASFSVSCTVDDSSISLTQSLLNNKLNQSQISKNKNLNNININRIQNIMPKVEEAQIEQSPDPVKNEEENNFRFPKQ